jgi:hypothetical protein
MKMLVILMLVAVVISLGSALSSMTKSGDRSKRMLNALIVRVAVSAALIIVLVVSWKFGFIEPPGTR